MRWEITRSTAGTSGELFEATRTRSITRLSLHERERERDWLGTRKCAAHRGLIRVARSETPRLAAHLDALCVERPWIKRRCSVFAVA
jgi:hypothetical protein